MAGTGLNALRSHDERSHLDRPMSDVSGSTLHVLVIGVGRYPEGSGPGLLPYSVASAKAVEEGFRQSAAAYRDVRVWPAMYEEGVTRAALQERFREMTEAIGPSDVVVLYFSGHGFVPPGQEMFYFMPYEGAESRLQATAISTIGLVDLVRYIPASRLLLVIDACQSGGALESLARIGDLKAHVADWWQGIVGVNSSRRPESAGVHVLAATLPLSYAIQGKGDVSALATVLIGALAGNSSGSVGQLLDEVERLLPEYSQRVFEYRQVPMRRSVGADFPLNQAKRRP